MNTYYSKQRKVQNIYQKSVRLLNDAQSQLHVMREIVDKAVLSLVQVSHSGNERVHKVIQNIKLSANDYDIRLLSDQLDEFILLTNDQNRSKNRILDINEDTNIKIESILIELLNSLSLPNDDSRKQQASILKHINTVKHSDIEWNEVTDSICLLINENIDCLHKNNKELLTFIFKINEQLTDLKIILKQTQQDRIETVEQSTALEKSVGASVCKIHDKVSTANSIDDLKNIISDDLDKIRRQVKENKIKTKEMENVSSERFSQLVNELDSTQGELTEIKTQLEITKSQLLRDPLTELYNRTAYEDRVEVEYSRCKRNKTPLSVAMWDIDHFKNINDSYGHDIGDRVLKAFAKVIQVRIRKTDMFVRFGGEEFILLMPDTTAQQALSLNDKLREKFSECKFSYHDDIFFVTSSVGIAEYSDDTSHEDLLKKADLALYESKSAGRNCCTIFNEES